MAGGLLQLVAYGSENQYLNGNPQLSFFKMVYKRYTNFSMQSIEVFFNGIDYLNYNDTTIIKTTIPRNADLFSNMFLCLDIPNIYASEDNQFKWIEQLGANMINYAKIICGGTVIEQFPGEYISIYHNINVGKEKTEIFNKLSGNLPEFYNPKEQSGRYPIYNSMPFVPSQNVMEPGYINRGYLNKPTIIGKRLYIPLPFWFHRNVGQSVPLIALQYHEIQVEIELKAIKDLYVVGKPNVITLDQSYDNSVNSNAIEPSKNSIDRIKWSRPLSVQDEIGNFTNLGNNTIVIKPTLEINYIFLDDKEREFFANNSHEFLIEKISMYEELGRRSYTNVELEAYHPVKEMIITARRSDVRDRNQWSNYTIRDTINSNPMEGQSFLFALSKIDNSANPIQALGKFKTDTNRFFDLSATTGNPPINYYVKSKDAYTYNDIVNLANQWEFRNPIDIPIINSQNYQYFTSNIIQDLEILFNGNIRLDRKKIDYFEKIQPLIHHNNTGMEGVLFYSFSIEPDRYQPSGSCNFSHIKTINLNINYKNPADFESGDYKKYLFDLKVYFIGYNLFRIMGGMGSLAFGN